MHGLLTRRPEWPGPAGEAQGALQMFGTSLAGHSGLAGHSAHWAALAGSVFLLSRAQKCRGRQPAWRAWQALHGSDLPP